MLPHQVVPPKDWNIPIGAAVSVEGETTTGYVAVAYARLHTHIGFPHAGRAQASAMDLDDGRSGEENAPAVTASAAHPEHAAAEPAPQAAEQPEEAVQEAHTPKEAAAGVEGGKELVAEGARDSPMHPRVRLAFSGMDNPPPSKRSRGEEPPSNKVQVPQSPRPVPHVRLVFFGMDNPPPIKRPWGDTQPPIRQRDIVQVTLPPTAAIAAPVAVVASAQPSRSKAKAGAKAVVGVVTSLRAESDVVGECVRVRLALSVVTGPARKEANGWRTPMVLPMPMSSAEQRPDTSSQRVVASARRPTAELPCEVTHAITLRGAQLTWAVLKGYKMLENRHFRISPGDPFLFHPSRLPHRIPSRPT